MRRNYNAAVIVAAGSGSRMKSQEHKQFMKIGGRPMLYYSMKIFEESPLVDEIIVVVASGEEERCYDEIIDKYRFEKVKAVIPGGARRSDSVYRGLCEIDGGCRYVFIHDGARPCLDHDMLDRVYSIAKAFDACIVGVKEKDTIRRVQGDGDVLQEVLDRDEIWHVQTPQVFSYDLVREAYGKYVELDYDTATDDAMVVERMTRHSVHITEGSYKNIKVTTKEDIIVVENYLGLAPQGKGRY